MLISLCYNIYLQYIYINLNIIVTCAKIYLIIMYNIEILEICTHVGFKYVSEIIIVLAFDCRN
jgi:hypothetical protein